MKDQNDNRTRELIDPPKRGRGRPKTGEAMTSAERQKAYRERNRVFIKMQRPQFQLQRLLEFLQASLDETRDAKHELLFEESRNRGLGACSAGLVASILTVDEFNSWSKLFSECKFKK